MNFELYDIFSKLIPGGLILSVLIFCGWIPYPVDNSELIYLIFSYFCGYLIDALSFEFQERILRKRNAKSILPKVFSDYKHISEISTKYGLNNWQIDPIEKKYSKMFHVAIKNERLRSFQNHWVGSRNLFFSYTICLAVLLMEIQELQITSPKWLGLVLLVFVIEIILLNHAKNRQNLMFLQVLNCYNSN